ncbi:MAG: hypothetical protein KDF54_05550 [Hydrogenophaga sp.]|nr:hypothetical protein [Hydrogenophaga sp.]
MKLGHSRRGQGCASEREEALVQETSKKILGFVDQGFKNGIYCKASLINVRRAEKVNDRTAVLKSCLRTSSAGRVKRKAKFFDATSKTGVYCEAPLIVAG